MGYGAASGSQRQRVGNQHIVAIWPRKKGGKTVGKPGQEICIYFRAKYDTLMSSGIFTWKVKWETEMECLLFCSKKNIWTKPATLIIWLHIMFICEKH